MTQIVGDLNPPTRLLCGTGPTNPDPRILRALAAPVLGQFDPAFTAIMYDVMALARAVFQTENQRTFAVSGTGRAGMEAAIASLIEPGDRVLVANCGRFGDLFADLATRYGARVTQVTAEWGRIIDPGAIEDALKRELVKVVAVVHGETSTGMLQSLEEIGQICREYDALSVVDAVVTLGGSPVRVDDWGIDLCSAGTQKCLGCPSGMAPITYNERAERAMAARRTPVVSNYLDLTQLQRYWSPERLNHHTLPTSMTYALREALRLVVEEGPHGRFERHHRAGAALKAGLAAIACGAALARTALGNWCTGGLGVLMGTSPFPVVFEDPNFEHRDYDRWSARLVWQLRPSSRSIWRRKSRSICRFWSNTCRRPTNSASWRRCTSLTGEIETALWERLPGVWAVWVELVWDLPWDPPWDPLMMSEAAQDRFRVDRVSIPDRHAEAKGAWA